MSEVQENPQSTGFQQLIEKVKKFSIYSVILNLKSRIHNCFPKLFMTMLKQDVNAQGVQKNTGEKKKRNSLIG